MHSQTNFQALVLICTQFFMLTSYMRLRLGYGKLFLSTFYESWKPLMKICFMSLTNGTSLLLLVVIFWCFDNKFCRFREVPTFGRDTIRRFTRNSSELKKMAAWNYEDFLQVCDLIFSLPQHVCSNTIHSALFQYLKDYSQDFMIVVC